MKSTVSKPDVLDGITADDISDALMNKIFNAHREDPKRPGEFTVEDMVKKSDMSESTVRKRLLAAYRRGVLTRRKISMPGKTGYEYAYKEADDVS